MKKNDVVSVITLAGEFVGKFQEFVDGNVSLKNPRIFLTHVKIRDVNHENIRSS